MEAEAAPAPDPAPADAAPAPEAPAPAPDFSWAGEQFHGDDGFKADDFRAHYEELLAENARRSEQPAAPESYEFAIPQDIDYGDVTLPEGFAPEIDPNDPAFQPMFNEFSELLRNHNLPQDAATGFMGLLAKYEARQQSRLVEAHQSEMAKLGQNKAQADARLSTAKRALESRMAPEQAQALMANIQSFEAFRALEKLLAPAGGSPPVPQPKTDIIDPIAARYPNSRKD